MAITASTIIKTRDGDFKVCFHEVKGRQPCLSFSQGDLTKGAPIVRFHSACLFGEVFDSIECDCRDQVKKAIELIKKNKNGVIIYSYREGRGIGIKEKIKAVEIQRINNCDTVDAFKKLGLKRSDYRTYKTEIQALKDLKASKTIQIFSGSPKKIKYLEKAGYIIKNIIKLEDKHLNHLAKEEIKTKKEKMGYYY